MAQAELRFRVSQPPPRPISDRFADIASAFANPLRPVQSLPNILANALARDLPKVALIVEIEKLRLPPVASEVFGLSAGARADLHAHSPHHGYVAGQSPVKPLARVQHHGGVLLLASDLDIAGRFGLTVTAAEVAFGITLTGSILPDVAADVAVGGFVLPFGLGTVRDGRVIFESRAIGRTPVVTRLQISGRVGAQAMLLTLGTGTKRLLSGTLAGGWHLRFTLPTIQQQGTNLVLGDPIHVSFGVSGTIHVTLAEGAAPKAELRNLRLTFRGKPLTLQPLQLTSAVDTPDTLIKALERAATTKITNDILAANQTAARWVRSIKDGTLRLASLTAETAARILAGLGLTMSQAITHLKSLFPAVADVIWGLYKAFGQNISAVLNALSVARYNTASAIVQAMFNLFGTTRLDALTASLWARFASGWRRPLHTLAALYRNAGFSAHEVIRTS